MTLEHVRKYKASFSPESVSAWQLLPVSEILQHFYNLRVQLGKREFAWEPSFKEEGNFGKVVIGEIRYSLIVGGSRNMECLVFNYSLTPGHLAVREDQERAWAPK